jgi:LPS export ABC transporter protein LptC
MISGSRNLLWLLPMLLLISYPFWADLAGKFLAPRGDFNSGAQRKQPKSFVLSKMFFLQHRKGELEWQINAERAYTISDELDVQMEEVDAVLFGKENQKTHVISGSANYDNNSQILTMMGGVNATTRDGYNFKSQELIYHARSQKIETFKDVELTGDELDISGEKMDYQINSGKLKVDGRVKVRFSDSP